MKARLIASLLMSLGLSFLMSGWVTLINLGWDSRFVGHWMAAWQLAWPAAAVCAFLLTPWVQRLTTAIVNRLP
ncbi:MAG: DUF2798 domain-containing protein [Roseibium sp.]|uniref:DUF2798 domain-containing protein n=1 Tax=Roseibium sp. TaxID=1936156 RepID=UPI001B11630F|nr:DUF2798 domain-containing protein [Roseibium sp.]MBO6893602.1 DUF2798 domain-containing protein [Roseibium sp.]MBO6928097.1 DUF2798 domain-containing protein [Roseibium sp.]